MSGIPPQDVETSAIQSISQMDITKLPRELVAIRMEHEQIASMAMARPRDPVRMVQMLVARVKAYKTFAAGAMYCKPVGKDDSGHMKYARGLSVRAAEAINSIYGFTSVNRNIERIDDMNARITVTWMDYQTGCRSSISRVVGRKYTKRGGGSAIHNEDRFWSVVVMAELAKIERDTILKSIDPGLKMELTAAIEEELDKYLDENTVKKLVASFSTIGVTAEQIETYIGKRAADFRTEDRKTLLGIWQALKDEETTVNEVFGGGEELEPTGQRVPPGYFEAMKMGDREKAQQIIGGPGFVVETINGIRQICRAISAKDGAPKTPPAERPPEKGTEEAKPTSTPEGAGTSGNAQPTPEAKAPKAADPGLKMEPKAAKKPPTAIKQLQDEVWEASRVILPSVAMSILGSNGIASQEEISSVTDENVLKTVLAELTEAKQ